MKEIKLFFVNYKYTVDEFKDLQKDFHRECFDKLLVSYRQFKRLPLEIATDIGKLHFVEATDTETHLVCKYYFKHDKAV